MPLKKSLREITIGELRDILSCLEKKYNQEKEEFVKFLPEIAPIFDRVCQAKRKKETAKTENKEQTGAEQTTGFTLIDEYLTEREREARYNNAIKAIKKFKETGELTRDEIKKCLVNAALVDFKNLANPEEIQLINQMAECLPDIPLLDEIEKKAVRSSSKTPIKKYELTDRVSIYLTRDFSLAKIEKN